MEKNKKSNVTSVKELDKELKKAKKEEMFDLIVTIFNITSAASFGVYGLNHTDKIATYIGGSTSGAFTILSIISLYNLYKSTVKRQDLQEYIGDLKKKSNPFDYEKPYVKCLK